LRLLSLFLRRSVSETEAISRGAVDDGLDERCELASLRGLSKSEG
jgi:hypothetical protein